MYFLIFFNFILCIKYILYIGKSNLKVRFFIFVDLLMLKLYKIFNFKYIYIYIFDLKFMIVILIFNKENF